MTRTLLVAGSISNLSVCVCVCVERERERERERAVLLCGEEKKGNFPCSIYFDDIRMYVS